MSKPENETRGDVDADDGDEFDLDAFLEANAKRGNGGGSPAKPTEAEQREMWEQFDRFAKGGSKSNKHLHPIDPATDEPLCSDREYHRKTDRDWPRSNTTQLRFGWWDICAYCAQRWRKDFRGSG